MSTSPRKRLSLVGSSSRFSGPASPSALGSQGFALKTSKSTKAGKAGKAWPYAARSARYRLLESREKCGSTPSQFAQAISALVGDAVSPFNQQQLLAMEAGFALVPSQVLASAEKLYADHQAELERQEASRPPVELSGGEYPYQEPMEGIDYQIQPPRYLGGVGGTKAMSREARKDELVYAPRMAVSAGVKANEYLEQARALIAGAEGSDLCFSEEVALSILHDLKYNSDAALAALKLCIAWQVPPSSDGPSEGKPGARAATANSVLWLQRLKEHAGRCKFSAGEVEALDAGIAEHGKELSVLHPHILREKSLQQLIEMYYVAGWRHQSP